MPSRRPKSELANVSPQALLITEGRLQENVRQLSKLLGLPYFHVHDSRRSPEGFPDCSIIVRDTLLMYELKTEIGMPTDKQQMWLDALSGVQHVRSGIFRPTQWVNGTIERALRGLPFD